jgi:hypothetical protein
LHVKRKAYGEDRKGEEKKAITASEVNQFSSVNLPEMKRQRA